MTAHRAAVPVRELLAAMRAPHARSRHWAQLGRACKLDRQTLYRLLYRGQTPRLDTLQQVAEALGGELVVLLPPGVANATLSQDKVL